MKNKALFLALGTIAMAFLPDAKAANITWTGGTSADFDTSTNWSGGVLPASADTAIINPTANSQTVNVSYSGNDTLTTLQLDNQSSFSTVVVNFNQTGGTLNLANLTLGTTGASKNSNYNISGGTLNISTGMGLGGGSASGMTISGGTVNYNGTAAYSVGGTSGGTSTLNISSGSYNASGAFTMNISNNSATGNVILSGTGQLNIGLATMSVGQFGTGTGTYTMGAGTSASIGKMVVGGTGAASTVKGIVNLNGGSLTTQSIQLGSSSTTPSATANVVNANGTAITVATGATNTDFFHAVYLNVKSGGLLLNTNGNATGITNIINGDVSSTGGGLTKSGTGTLTLSGGASTYTGATTVNAGTLVISSGSSIASTVLAATGGTIQFVGATTLTGGSPSLTLNNSGGFADTLSAVSDGVTLSTLTVGSGGGTLDGDGTTNVTYTFGSTGSVFNGFLTLNSWDSVNDKLVFADTLNSTQLGDIILSGMIATGQDGSNAVVFAVPEPSELALLGLSGVLLFGMLRFRKVRAIA